MDNFVQICIASASLVCTTYASARSTINSKFEPVRTYYERFRRVMYLIFFFPDDDDIPNVGIMVETRYNGVLAKIVVIMNICGIISIICTIISVMILNNFFGSNNTPYFQRFAGIAHLTAVVVVFICVKLVTPPAIRYVEIGMPVIFPYMYGLFLGIAQLIIALHRETSEAWCQAEALLIMFSIALLITSKDTFKEDCYNIDRLLVEVAERNYGAFYLEFFKQLQAEYTGPSETCPVWVDGDSLYIKEYGHVKKSKKTGIRVYKVALEQVMERNTWHIK